MVHGIHRGGKQYVKGWLDMAGPSTTVEEWFVDAVKKKSRGRGQKGKGAYLLKYLLGPKNVPSALKESK